MSTAGYDGEVYEDGQQFKDDQKLMVKFYKQPIKMEAASIAEGRPIYQNFVYIHIMVPGQRDDLKTEDVKRTVGQQSEQIAAMQQAISDLQAANKPKVSLKA